MVGEAAGVGVIAAFSPPSGIITIIIKNTVSTSARPAIIATVRLRKIHGELSSSSRKMRLAHALIRSFQTAAALFAPEGFRLAVPVFRATRPGIGLVSLSSSIASESPSPESSPYVSS